MPENLNRFVPGVPSSYVPEVVLPGPNPVPEGGVGSAAGGWDTAANRDAAINIMNQIITHLSIIERKLRELGIID